ncbi:methionine--tRNA ligase [Bacillus sp. AFS002410]|uniref:methionine--tRNA ligase n=1 Tax=Bacillus sp. AFS002410 TaxID=2033481 RepID=UPI000BEF75DC|nr:methionine--tRNA ligase [Bacillus sp. AFS002410]PEJ57467.1 methionine--tRNA ligase [Bacillus sp. AFS002410]
MDIFIGGAWPYANGSLHLGHIAALLPGDILARYYRLKKANVLYVSGSDCNGTPIAIKAKQENVTYKEIADRYHNEFENNFRTLGFTYDCYTRTDAEHHHTTVQDIFLNLLQSGLIYKKEIEQCYCEEYQQFLPDRYVEGTCPNCGQHARGDQCDFCSAILDPLDLLNKTCKLCGNPPSVKTTEHFYFSLSKLQDELKEYYNFSKENGNWRSNAIQLTERYLNEGLHDRAVSRDLPNGVSVPVKGYEQKKIYVWIEAVSGYYSASKQWASITNKVDANFWNKETRSYYIHGKDNIPFHTIIWPSILIGLKKEALPTHIVSNEYLTLEKKKLSTSKNWAVWVPDIIQKYHPDSIRYFLTMNAPENRDTDFSWREFIYSHNSELLGAYGNFINRTLKFIEKYYNGEVPEGEIDKTIRLGITRLYKIVGSHIEATNFKKALEEIFEFIRSANKYFDETQPWKQVKESPVECHNTMASCIYTITNLAQILHPFLPFSSNEIKEMLNIPSFEWNEISSNLVKLNDVKPLFERIDISRIDEELERLINESTI